MPTRDANYTVTLSKHSVTVYDPKGLETLTGWGEHNVPKLWRFYLRPNIQPNDPPYATNTTLRAFRAYDLPSTGSLVLYLHAYSGFPVSSNWLAAIKAGN